MEQHEYEWVLYAMRGQAPSNEDECQASGTAQTHEEAELEAMHYLSQYANDDTGFRVEGFEVTRTSLGCMARLPAG